MNFGQYDYRFGIETILERRSSRFYNITIAQSGSLRMIRFDMLGFEGVIHLKNSSIVLFDYMHLQLLCLLWNSTPERILIIGLGAGILPKIFHYLSPRTLIHIVEIDFEVINLARKYFDFKENNMIRIFAEDGRYFIERQPSNQYDVIIIDAFTANGRIPHALRTIECLKEYLRILKSTGLVVANFLYEQESRYRETYSRAHFKHIYRGITPGNYILIGLNKEANIFNQTELQIRAEFLQQNKSLPNMNWIEEVKYIRNGNDNKWNISAAIFTDKVHEES
ncbi:unnamed protein product [Adineta steineri]|uniref:PABS domain-containing protein n=1 Tax=Adineta steineri TaxID=433720 RepID=A0A814AW67_9BILA|nr:unnamed protein product [Adineta steineri]CAF0917608.1 unnamed protein product [Adineta steineri]CAF0961972.1 unnamed protein product [Adineta steineri]